MVLRQFNIQANEMCTIVGKKNEMSTKLVGASFVMHDTLIRIFSIDFSSLLGILARQMVIIYDLL